MCQFPLLFKVYRKLLVFLRQQRTVRLSFRLPCLLTPITIVIQPYVSNCKNKISFFPAYYPLRTEDQEGKLCILNLETISSPAV